MTDLDNFPVQLSGKNLLFFFWFFSKKLSESSHGLFAMVLFTSKLLKISCLYLSQTLPNGTQM